ncbi:unnamed protein product, partial [Larinioides sclopetarius]
FSIQNGTFPRLTENLQFTLGEKTELFRRLQRITEVSVKNGISPV